MKKEKKEKKIRLILYLKKRIILQKQKNYFYIIEYIYY